MTTDNLIDIEDVICPYCGKILDTEEENSRRICEDCFDILIDGYGDYRSWQE